MNATSGNNYHITIVTNIKVIIDHFLKATFA